MADEMRYQKKGWSDIRVEAEKIAEGLVAGKDAIKGMDLIQLQDLTKELEKQKKAVEGSPVNQLMKSMQPKASAGETAFQRILLPQMPQVDNRDSITKALEATRLRIKEILASMQKDQDEADDKALKALSKFLDKYNEYCLSKTLEGRIELIEKERAEAESSNEYKTLQQNNNLAAMAQVDKFYNDKILEEKKKHFDKVQENTDKYLKEIADAEEKQGELVFKYNEDMLKKSEDLRKKDFEKRNKALSEYSELRRQYLLTDTARLEEDYKIQRDLLINSDAWKLANKAQQDAILLAMEIQHQKALTEAKVAEWERQYQLSNFVMEQSFAASEQLIAMQLTALIEAGDVTQKTLSDLWNSIKQSFAKALISMLVEKALFGLNLLWLI